MELPIFPEDVIQVNSRIAIKQDSGMVYYFHYMNPIHVHNVSDRNSFRYVTASLVVSGMCKIHELSKALGVKRRNIERYSKHLREEGMTYFFAPNHTGGKAHKITSDKLVIMQQMLNEGKSITAVGKAFEVSEGAIRHYIRKGTLKKSLN
jgi:transposase